MATGISPQLPLVVDENDGAYKLNKTLIDVVKQNLKCLVLTSPGERIMDPLFGVGLRNFLFEQNLDSTYTLISEKIREQVSKYMPFLEIIDIDIYGNPDEVFSDNRNFAKVSINYRVLPLDVDDILDIIETVD